MSRVQMSHSVCSVHPSVAQARPLVESSPLAFHNGSSHTQVRTVFISWCSKSQPHTFPTRSSLKCTPAHPALSPASNTLMAAVAISLSPLARSSLSFNGENTFDKLPPLLERPACTPPPNLLRPAVVLRPCPPMAAEVCRTVPPLPRRAETLMVLSKWSLLPSWEIRLVNPVPFFPTPSTPAAGRPPSS